MEKLIEKANVLVEALPYIKEFYGKTVVIKYGGSAMTNPSLKRDTIVDIVLMKYVGINPVVVHGGGPEITQMMERLGLKASFIDGKRVTDEETMEIVEMTLAGKINKEIVASINYQGGQAIGICGKDANLITATQAKDPKLGLVGEVKQIRPAIIQTLIKDYIPVIAPIGFGEDGRTYNINADTVAGELARALHADKLVILTDTPGVMRDGKCISTIHGREEIKALFDEKVISEGMIPKVQACIRALEGGVRKTHIIDGGVKHAILLEIFTDKGIGTEISI
ncbi:MAG: acetylglutamate kinase [bacterium]